MDVIDDSLQCPILCYSDVVCFFPLPGNHMILPKVSNVNKNETEIANGNKQYRNSHFFIYFCIYL